MENGLATVRARIERLIEEIGVLTAEINVKLDKLKGKKMPTSELEIRMKQFADSTVCAVEQLVLVDTLPLAEQEQKLQEVAKHIETAKSEMAATNNLLDELLHPI
jgi:hypothetical protein